MCLLTRQKEPIILKDDKIVWKRLSSFDGRIESHYYHFQWVINNLYRTKISFSDDITAYDDRQGDMYRLDQYTLRNGVISIGEGFHAFCNWNYAVRDSRGHGLFECTIPAGSEYYEDETGLCVSNQIIINKQLFL